VSEQGTGERMVRLELKYCECCGGLLLRQAGGDAVYCGPCARKMSEMAVKTIVPRRRGKTQVSCANVGHEADGGGCGTPGKIGPKSVSVEAAKDRRQG